MSPPPQSAAESGGPPSPVSTSERAVAPDLARGVMLLLIALAHAPAYLHGLPNGPSGLPLPGALVDQLVVIGRTELVVGRAYPMFAALFGYGIVQMLTGKIRAGTRPAAARALVRRRGAWLLVFGFMHALLLFSGDILGAYGVLSVAVAGLLARAGTRLLLTGAGLSLLVVVAGGATAGAAPESTVFTLTDPLHAAAARVTEWAPTLLLQPLGLLGAALLGAWAAQWRVLEEPQRHRRLLRCVAAAGLSTAILGAVPMTLIAASLWPDPSEWAFALASGLHYGSGYGGVGYAALIGLLAIRLRERPGRIGMALVACGQRSLSCYLAQSVVFVAVLASYGGGLGARLGLVETAAVGALTWVGTVAAAEAMRRRRYRGPAETLLRRLTYGRPAHRPFP